MKLNHFALREGKIVYVPDVPKKPHFLEDATDHAQYKTSLAFAIANGIEVADQGGVAVRLWGSLPLQKNTLYPLQCKVEIREEMYMTNPPRPTGYKVARVTFETTRDVE